MKNQTKISTAALNRIITAQRVKGYRQWSLNFSKAQARKEGLTEKQIKEAEEAFGYARGAYDKKGMIEVVYAAIVG